MIGEMIAKRKWHLLLPFIIVVSVALILINMLPDIYRVQSTLLFESQSSLSGDVERHLLPGTRTNSRQRRDDRMEQANVLRMKVLAPRFLGLIADKLGYLNDPYQIQNAQEKKELTGDPKSVEEIVLNNLCGWFGSMVEINLAGPSVYMISVQGKKPSLLYELANTINTELIRMVHEEQLGLLHAAADFTDDQIALYKKKSDEAKGDLQRFLATRPMSESGQAMTNIDPVVASRLAEETGFEMLRITEQRDEARALLQQVYGYNGDTFLEAIRPQISLQVERLQSLEKQLGYLLLDRSWNDPAVIAHNTRIGNTRIELEKYILQLARVTLTGRPLHQHETASTYAASALVIEALELRRATLRQESLPMQTGLSPRALSRWDQQLEFLEEQVRINEEIYRSFVRQATSTRISEAVETEQLNRSIQIINPPNWPSAPVQPNKPQLYAIAVVLGIALGVVFLIAGEYLDTSVKDVHEAEELVGAPILGTIPKIEYQFIVDPRNRMRRGLVFSIIGVVLAGAVIGYFLYYGGANVGEESETSYRITPLFQTETTDSEV